MGFIPIDFLSFLRIMNVEFTILVSDPSTNCYFTEKETNDLP
jgi:hypothetical protein